MSSTNATESPSLATFAGGCFWCMEKPFAALPGIISMVVGYTGGHVENPSYEDVSTGETGHTEAIQLVYDPALASYEDLLDVFWRSIDPVDARGQFADRGSQYRTAIFWHTEAQRQAAEVSKSALEASGLLPGKIMTSIEEAGAFYPAEEYHQGYYKKQPLRYLSYSQGSGRPTRLEQLWGPKQKS